MAFLGRSTDLAALTRLWDEAKNGAARVALVRGAPGIGKTTLINELFDTAEGTVFRGTCQEDSSIPYLSVGTALRPLWPDQGSPFERLVRNDAATPVTPSSLEARFGLLLETTSALLERAAHESVLVGLDDLHWADAATIELIAHLVQSLSDNSTARLLLVLAMRPTGSDSPVARLVERAGREPIAGTLDVTGLDLVAVHELVVDLKGKRPSKAFLRALHEASGGNPLLVRSLLERLEAFGAIAYRGDTLVQTSVGELVASPRDLDQLLRDRLADLSETCRRLLVVAAFLGDGGSMATLETLSGLNEERLERAIDEARAAHLLDDDGSTFRFDHSQLRQLLYQTPRGRRRAELHLRIADHLEATGDAQDPSTVMSIANHLRRATNLADSRRVERWCVPAARLAFELGAWAESADAYDAALEAMHASSAEATAYRALIETRAAYAHWYNHDNAKARAQAQQAIDVARTLGDVDLWTSALVVYARAIWSSETPMGEPGATKPLEIFLDEVGEGDRHSAAVVHRLLAELRQIGEDLDGAAFHLERARELSEGGDDLVLEVDLAVCAGIQRLWKGEPTKAVEDFRQAADLAASTGDSLSLQMARSRQAIALFTIAELDAARSLAEQAGRETAPAGLWAEHGVALTVQCSVACASGELERAVELGTNARRIAAWSGDAQTTSIALPALVWASAACGDHPAAQRHLDEWSGVGSDMVDYHRAMVHALAGEHDAARSAYASAPASSTDAMTLARSAGFLVELAELLDDDIDLAVPYLVLSEMATREVWFSMGWCQFSPRLAGVAAARLGDRESAERWLGRALDVASKAGARVEFARVEANLAELI